MVGAYTRRAGHAECVTDRLGVSLCRLEKKAKKSQRKAAHGAAAVGTRSITSFFGGGKGNGKGKGKTKTATQAAADA